MIVTETLVPGSTGDPPTAALSNAAVRSDTVVDDRAFKSIATSAIVAYDVGGNKGGNIGGGRLGVLASEGEGVPEGGVRVGRRCGDGNPYDGIDQ